MILIFCFYKVVLHICTQPNKFLSLDDYDNIHLSLFFFHSAVLIDIYLEWLFPFHRQNNHHRQMTCSVSQLPADYIFSIWDISVHYPFYRCIIHIFLFFLQSFFCKHLLPNSISFILSDFWGSFTFEFWKRLNAFALLI